MDHQAQRTPSLRASPSMVCGASFGTGLVETTEDFGIMGQRPTRPELLDWLAVVVPDSGWNIKHIYKLMVMRATYRQSSKASSQQLTKIPGTYSSLAGRGSGWMLEMVRDIALQSGGLLVAENRRTQRQALPTTQYSGASNCTRPATRCITPRACRFAPPRQHPVHICEAHGTSASTWMLSMLRRVTWSAPGGSEPTHHSRLW